jgi:peptidoglycan/LPS O-acetylase OafA/YrhL
MATPANDSLDQKALAPADGGRFLVLDGLRGIAAFAVILDHVASETLRAMLPGRYLAVDFFFVLSGFVLAHAYGERLTKGLSPLGFLKLRLIRLYPLYLLGLALALIPPLFGALRGWNVAPLSEVGIVAAISLFFIPVPPVFGWTSDHLYPLDRPAWSLFFELVANVIYAAIARFLTWRVFAVVLPILALAVMVTAMRHPDVGGPGWLWAHFDAGLARVMFEFFAGVALYRLRGQLRIPALPAWGSALALLAIIAVPASGLWRPAYDVFAGIVLMPLLVAFASGAKVNGLAAKVCGALGLLSYGVYVLHAPLLDLVVLAFTVLHTDLPFGFLNVLLVAGLAALAAALAHRVYDLPVRRWLIGAFSGRAKPA